MQDYGAGRENFRGRIGTTAAGSEPWRPERKQVPEGAPNVVVIALDDTGFAHLACYWSSTAMTLEKRPWSCCPGVGRCTAWISVAIKAPRSKQEMP